MRKNITVSMEICDIEEIERIAKAEQTSRSDVMREAWRLYRKARGSVKRGFKWGDLWPNIDKES